jgi:hypothetical protein
MARFSNRKEIVSVPYHLSTYLLGSFPGSGLDVRANRVTAPIFHLITNRAKGNPLVVSLSLFL